MEGELREAIGLYQENIAAVQGSLAGDPDNAELQQLLGELEEALASTQQALQELGPQPLAAPELPPSSEAMHGGEAAAAASQPPIGPQLPPAAAVAAGAAAGAGVAGPAAGGARSMHPRNKYAAEAPDFAALAEEFPSLQPYLQRHGPGSRPSIDFTNPEACRELTRVLLRHDYGVEWWVPLGQLVPPVTNRANYIHWLEDLLALSCPPGEVVGLDVGCGANLIYPLLGAAIKGWHFVGVDVTEVALEWAEANRRSNPQLAPLIEVRRAPMQPRQHDMLRALPGKGSGLAAGASGGRARRQGRPAKRARQGAGQQKHQHQHQHHDAKEQGQEHHAEDQQQGVADSAMQSSLELGSIAAGAEAPSEAITPEGHSIAHKGLAASGQEGEGQVAAAATEVAGGGRGSNKRVGASPTEGEGGGGPGCSSRGIEAQQPKTAEVAAAPPAADVNREGASVAAAAAAALGGSGAARATVGAGILSGAVRPGECFAFCMCNPPFFESMEEAGRNPATAFAGTAAEMVYPGGELAFVTSMVDDSLTLHDKIHWYTTMVGKKGTMKALRTLLYHHSVRVLRTTEFVQGKTSRWAVAWSWVADPSVNQLPLPRQPPAPQFV